MDWRLTNQEKYLKDETLIKRKYIAGCDEWDHEHCEFCWKKFMEEVEGYTNLEQDVWICEQCFADFQERFNWEVIPFAQLLKEVLAQYTEGELPLRDFNRWLMLTTLNIHKWGTPEEQKHTYSIMHVFAEYDVSRQYGVQWTIEELKQRLSQTNTG